MEQTTLLFEQDRVLWVTNSNFLQGKTPLRALLGQFEIPYTDALLKEKRRLAQLKAEAKSGTEIPSGGEYESPHAIRVYVGAIRIPASSGTYGELLGLLERAEDLAWKPSNAAELVRGKGDAVSMRKLPDGKSESPSCSELDRATLLCRTDRHGIARFARSSEQLHAPCEPEEGSE